jgi:hypothetical protein
MSPTSIFRGGISLATKEKTFTEDEIASLAQQLTFEEAFSDLIRQEFKSDSINARIERDKEVMKYYISKQTDIIGAKKSTENGKLKYEIESNGYNIVARQGSERNTVDHEGLWQDIETRKIYYDTMVDRYKIEADLAKTEEEKTLKLSVKDIWQAKLDTVKEVIDIKGKFTKTSSPDSLTLRFSKIKEKKSKKK